MKSNKIKGLYFSLGTFDEEKQKGTPLVALRKKSQVLPRGSLLLKRHGHVWIKVVYGKGKDCWGEISTFYNDGVYKTMKDLKFALQEFTDTALVEEFTKG